MAEKEFFERHFFDRFVKLFPDLPDGIHHKTEAPDFLIKGDYETIGIEISKIPNEREPGEPYSPSQKNAVEQKIAQEALKTFLAKHNIPLHVDFAFHDNIDVGKGRGKVLTVELAQLVAYNVTKKSLESNFHVHLGQGLPRELMYCSIEFFPGITESIWYSAKGQMMPSLKKDHLLRIIGKKESRVDEYRTRADKLILLLIEGVAADSWFDKIEPIPNNELNTRFDKVLIFRNLSDEIEPFAKLYSPFKLSTGLMNTARQVCEPMVKAPKNTNNNTPKLMVPTPMAVRYAMYSSHRLLTT